MKKITCFFLVLLALVFIFPVLFLVVGSLMGKNELTDLLFPVLQEGAKGYASWKAVSGISDSETLCGSTAGFTGIFRDVLELGEDYGWCPLAGGLLVGMPAAWGFAKFDFPGKNILFTLYIALMMMPFQVMLLGNYLVLDKIGLLTRFWGLFSRRFFLHSPYLLCTAFSKGFLWRFWKRQDLTVQVSLNCFL